MYDLLIIGGGPAGLSAAMTARNRNLSVCVICGGAADSALYKAGHVKNYPGVPDVSGPVLLETMTQQTRDLGADILRERALSAMPMGKTFGVSAGKEFAEGRALLLATGIAQRGTFPGETDYLGRGVSYCATCDGMLYRGKPVAVVGRSPDAPEEANFLKNLGCQVTYLAPKRPETLDADIPFVPTGTVSIQGQLTVTGLTANGESIPCAGVFILRPAVAPTDLLPTLATANGAIQVDRSMATNLPGVFAAGDCTGAPYQIAKAAGEGQVAALSACAYLDDPAHQIT